MPGSSPVVHIDHGKGEQNNGLMQSMIAAPHARKHSPFWQLLLHLQPLCFRSSYMYIYMYVSSPEDDAEDTVVCDRELALQAVTHIDALIDLVYNDYC